MARKILIICVDGLGPEYLAAAHTPTLDRLRGEGFATVGRCVIPSLTNVNNVSIITGAPPREHGITANYWRDGRTGEETLMESADFVLRPTILQRAKAMGLTTALLTAKRKLLHLLGAGADYTLAAEAPDADMVRRVGPAEDIYSPGINPWLFRALRVTLRERNPDLVYCSTTDGMMHKHAPDQEQSVRHVEELDGILGQIVDDDPQREVYLTADHGMSAKSEGLDLGQVLLAQGIAARSVPLIKDRYVAHHQNLGGATYVYLEQPEQLQPALAVLCDTLGVEYAQERVAAAAELELMPERIGDILALADRATVFGSFPAARVEVSLRSHGSRHESAVPIMAWGREKYPRYERNFDVVARLGLESAGNPLEACG